MGAPEEPQNLAPPPQAQPSANIGNIATHDAPTIQRATSDAIAAAERFTAQGNVAEAENALNAAKWWSSQLTNSYNVISQWETRSPTAPNPGGWSGSGPPPPAQVFTTNEFTTRINNADNALKPKPTVTTSSGGGGGGGYSAPAPEPVLIPGRDALNFSTTTTAGSELLGFIFEDIGGGEIISLLKRNTIDGLNPDYVIISNLSQLRLQFNPTAYVSPALRTGSYFDVFQISLLDKIPDDNYLLQNNLENFYYIAPNGDLVIEFDNLADGEEIQVDIVTSGTIKELD